MKMDRKHDSNDERHLKTLKMGDFHARVSFEHINSYGGSIKGSQDV